MNEVSLKCVEFHIKVKQRCRKRQEQQNIEITLRIHNSLERIKGRFGKEFQQTYRYENRNITAYSNTF